MLGSQVCWQLLLGWALLLGQPVFGDPAISEEPRSAESEAPVLVSQESEEPVSESEEPEEAEPEDIMSRALTFEEFEMLFGPSDEEVEERARENRLRLESALHDPSKLSVHFLKGIALRYHNQKSNYLYTPYENGNVQVKKAIGTVIDIKFLLVKTNCTKEDGEALRRLYGMMYDVDEMVHNPSAAERKKCEVPPGPQQEVLECTFTLFRDARRKYSPDSVIRHNCVLFGQQQEYEY